MSVDLIPDNETDRLAAVHRYDVLDTPPDGAFDRITALAARLFDVPISLVSVVDTDRIWFKSRHGIDVEEVGRDPGLCASAILHDAPWLVTDASVDPRTLTNPLVRGEFGLRFYAGVPLETHDGYNLGTLCIIDTEPREITEEEVQTLSDLASVVVDELELRLAAKETVSLSSELRRSAEDAAHTLQQTLLPVGLPEIEGFDIDARYHVARDEELGGDFYDVIDLEDGEGCLAVVGDACGKGMMAGSLTGSARWTLRALALHPPIDPAVALRRLNEVLGSEASDPERYCTVALAVLRPRPEGGATLEVSLGGHPQPLVVRASGEVEPVGEPGTIVGCLTDPSFDLQRVELASGDVLVMFTDGLFEAVGGHGSVDDAPLRKLLRGFAGDNATEVADRIDKELVGRLRDDAAFLVVGAR